MNIKPSLALLCLAFTCAPALAGISPDAARVIDRALTSAAQLKEYAAEVTSTGSPGLVSAMTALVSITPSVAAMASMEQKEVVMYRAPGYLWSSAPFDGSRSRMLKLADGKMLYRYLSHSGDRDIDVEPLSELSSLKLRSHPGITLDAISPLYNVLSVLDSVLSDPSIEATLLKRESAEGVLCDVVEIEQRAAPPVVPFGTTRRMYVGVADGMIRRLVITAEFPGVPPVTAESRYVLGKPDPIEAFKYERFAEAVNSLLDGKPFPTVSTQLNEVGTPLPEVGGKLADGKDLRWQDFRGKVLVVETWGTTCTYCKYAMPYYEKMRKQFAGQGVVFVALNFEPSQDAYEKWVRNNREKYGFTFARGEMTADNWQEQMNRFKGALPGFYVVGRDGNIVAAYKGFGYGNGGDDPRLLPALAKAGVQVESPMASPAKVWAPAAAPAPAPAPAAAPALPKADAQDEPPLTSPAKVRAPTPVPVSAPAAAPTAGKSNSASAAAAVFAGVADPAFKIGDAAPPLEAMAWIKGKPVRKFEPGRVYVIEFWATWCVPCRELMPHLSDLQRKHADRLTVIGVNVRETDKGQATQSAVEKFVQRQGADMDYTVAMDDPVKKTIFNAWMIAAGAYRIPTYFVIDGKGTLVWVGHPVGSGAAAFDTALEQALAGKSDLAAARAMQAEVVNSNAGFAR